MKRKIRVLSLDGGGIRGIIPATVLQYIEESIQEKTKNPNARLVDYFDLIAGTSTGGILTCFYLTPNPSSAADAPSSKFTAQDALDFYVNKGFSIFNQSKIRMAGIKQLWKAVKYNVETLEDIFNENFGNLKLSELLKPCLVTTYDLLAEDAFFFNSRDSKANRDFLVKDVVRSTSAAPTYFEPARVNNIGNTRTMLNLDGGVFANNPAMCAYAECRDFEFSDVKNPGADDILMISIGTGAAKLNMEDVGNAANWGVINWAKSAPEIMMDGSVDAVDFQMRCLFDAAGPEGKFNYKRINVPMANRNYSKDMADASPANIAKLKTAGKMALEDALRTKPGELDLNHIIDLLIQPVEADLA